MIALIQRTLYSKVEIDGVEKSSTGRGFLILLGVNVNDSEKEMNVLVDKVSKLRIFEDNDGNVYSWFTTSQQAISVGMKCTVTGTIKAHVEYKSIFTTQLNRCIIKEA